MQNAECRMKDCPPRNSLITLHSAFFILHSYCAADLLPSGDPLIGVPCGSGRAATEKPSR